MPNLVLENNMVCDEYTKYIEESCDYRFSGKTIRVIENNLIIPESWNIGLLIGGSGSGKSSLLKQFGVIKEISWDNNKSIISNFTNTSPENAFKICGYCGLNSIPSLCLPYSCLSTGEKFRADVARQLSYDQDIYLIDEFTSVVDRETAKSLSYSLSKFIRKTNKKVIVATCHADIIEWLCPDFIYDTDKRENLPRGSLCRPPIQLEIFRTKYEAWELFKHHHYLDNKLNKSARCFIAYYNKKPCAFMAILAFPNGSFKNGWRGSRLVVLPEYQGLGIGTKLSDFFGSVIKYNSGLYYSRTRHPAMIRYQESSPHWEPVGSPKYTTISGKNRTKHGYNWKLDTRECRSFKYIGPPSSYEESKVFWENL